MSSQSLVGAACTCLLCGGTLDGMDRRFPGGRLDAKNEVHSCRRCGSAQVMPRPTAAEIADLYSQQYFEGFLAGSGFKGGTSDASPVLRGRLAEAQRRLGGPGRMIDVGCAFGLFVAYARDQGWESIGVEPSQWAAEEGQRRFGIQIHNGTLETLDVAPASIDLINANHVLEHLLDPVGTLKTAAQLLRPQGLLALEVPQELRRPLSDRVYGWLHPALYMPFPPDPTHLQFFSPAGLKAALVAAGFRPLVVKTRRHDAHVASRLPLGSFAKRILIRAEEVTNTAPDLVVWARREVD